MDLTKLSKTELLEKCGELGIIKCKSKNIGELIDLINLKTQAKKQVKLIIQDNDIIDADNNDNDKDNSTNINENIEDELILNLEKIKRILDKK